MAKSYEIYMYKLFTETLPNLSDEDKSDFSYKLLDYLEDALRLIPGKRLKPDDILSAYEEFNSMMMGYLEREAERRSEIEDAEHKEQMKSDPEYAARYTKMEASFNKVWDESPLSK